jgi:hypothetical protein
MKCLIILLALSINLIAEVHTIEFQFTHTAEKTTSPQVSERLTRMEVTFDSKKMEGKLKSYSPFSDSFEIHEVKVKIEDKGIHFIEEKKNGMAILSMSMNSGEASYSNSSTSYGVLMSYQLYGNGRILEQR